MRSIILLLCFSLFINITSSEATIFVVNTTNDGVDINPGDGICQNAAGNCSLRAAIQECNALAGADQIVLGAGTYQITIGGANEDACSSGDLDISSEISIIGADAWTTIIDGNRFDRVFHVTAAGILTISQATVKGGLVISGIGAGFLNQGNLTINYCCIDTNACILGQGLAFPGGFGGGIANQRTLTVNNTTFQKNVAQGGVGNDAKNGGGGGGSSPGFGGALYNENLANASLTNCTLSGNRALGAKSSRGSTNGGNFTFNGASGAGPAAGGGGAAGGGAGGNGGAFSGGGGGGSSCSVGGNGGSGGYGSGGGGRGARSCGGASGNVGIAGFGGGDGDGSCCSSSGGGGAGAGFGGGVFNNGGTVTITSSTIAFNEALGGFGRTGQGGYAARGLQGSGLGGGLFNRSGTFNINNSILSNNLADILNSSDVSSGNNQGDLFGTFGSSDGHNLVMTAGTAVLGGNTTNNILNQDPSLLPLGNNGGSSNTHESDPCVPSVVIDAGFASVALDQRDLAHLLTADIGAFEQQDPCILLSEEIIKFSGLAQKNLNLLEWQIKEGNNFQHYELYRSPKGIQWKLLTNNNNNTDYYSDKTPYTPVSYYRLKCIQSDGGYSFSKTIALERRDKDDVLIVSPNPFNQDLTIKLWENIQSEIKISILDSRGRLCFETEKKVTGKEVRLTSVNSLTKGVYILKIEIEGNLYTRKLVRQ